MILQLTDQEAGVLAEVLEASRREKLHELHRTDSLGYKALLKDRIAVLEELRTRLAQNERVA